MIFDFVKNAGEKMMSFFNNDHSNEQKAEKITEFVNKLGFEVNNFEVKVNDDKATVCGEACDQATRERTVVAVGNVEGIAQVEDTMTIAAATETPVTETPVFYTVQSGDTLSKISKSYYGDPMQYNTIFEANKPMLSDPNKIYPGQTLRIPGANKTTVA